MPKGIWVYKDGKFVEKAEAAPEQLPSRLRQLPSDLVTKDADDPHRVHAEDPPHILRSLVKEQAQREVGFVNPFLDEAGPQAPKLPNEHTSPKLEQWKIDLVALRVKRAWAETQKDNLRLRIAPNFAPHHLWFKANDVRIYELREGNAPPDSERPKHLRRFNLTIDITDATMPPELLARLEERGLRVDGAWAELVRQSLSPAGTTEMQ